MKTLFIILAACMISNQDVFALPILNDSGPWSVTWENDLLSLQNTDRHYTNGLQLTKTSDSYDQFDQRNTFSWLAEHMHHLPLGRNHWLQHRTTLSIGQIMQTPEDLNLIETDPNDTPYGGLLYVSHGLEAYAIDYVDYFTLMLGVTGQYSLAEEAQTLIHSISGSEEPQGWDNQIPTEPIVNVYYSRRMASSLWQSANGWKIDHINYGRLALGNAQTDALMGSGVSWHQNAINSLSIRPGRLARDMIISHDPLFQGQGWFLYGGVSAKAVIWDVFLDGTLFRDSPSVEKENLVGQFVSNIGYKWQSMSIHFSWTLSSPTFEQQDNTWDHYGSINVSWGSH